MAQIQQKQHQSEKLQNTEMLQQNLQQAINLQLAGNMLAAERKYRSILKKAPNHTDALQFLAVILQQSDHPSAADYFIKKAVKSAPKNAQVLINQAEIYRDQGDLDKTQLCAERALSLNPDLIDAFVILGAVCFQKQQLQTAKLHFNHALKINPYDVSVHNQLANVLCLQDHNQEAVEHYQQALSIQPDFHDCRVNLADTLIDLGEIRNAISHYQHVLERQPENTPLLIRLGAAFEKRGDTEKAIQHYQMALEKNPELIEARINMGRVLLSNNPQQSEKFLSSILKIDPDNADAHYWLGIHSQTMGRFEKATRYFQQAILLRPDFYDAWHRLSQNRGYIPTQIELKDLEFQVEQIRNNENKGQDLITLSFTLGRFHDQQGNHDSAFCYFQQGNRVKAKKYVFDKDKHEQQINDIIKTFDAEFFSQRQGWGNQSRIPVFIVGMPRSGTTLVEQILSTHTELYGAGELEFMQQQVRYLSENNDKQSISHAGTTRQLNQQQVKQQADNYLRDLQKLQPESKGIVDKLPGNYLRLGLIRLLFPQARIIHCRRDPMDTCWSCFQQNFEKGLSFSNNLKNLGFAYLNYIRLIEHWHKTLSTEILDINYEQLIENPADQSRRLLQYCGLKWDPAVLDYHQQVRPVSSASQWQVRQPLYKTSIGRWKNYQQYLKPLQRILAA